MFQVLLNLEADRAIWHSPPSTCIFGHKSCLSIFTDQFLGSVVVTEL